MLVPWPCPQQPHCLHAVVREQGPTPQAVLPMLLPMGGHVGLMSMGWHPVSRVSLLAYPIHCFGVNGASGMAAMLLREDAGLQGVGAPTSPQPPGLCLQWVTLRVAMFVPSSIEAAPPALTWGRGN